MVESQVSLKDALESGVASGPELKLDKILRELPEEDAEALRAALVSDYPQATLAKAARKAGLNFSETAVRNWRERHLGE